MTLVNQVYQVKDISSLNYFEYFCFLSKVYLVIQPIKDFKVSTVYSMSISEKIYFYSRLRSNWFTRVIAFSLFNPHLISISLVLDTQADQDLPDLLAFPVRNSHFFFIKETLYQITFSFI